MYTEVKELVNFVMTPIFGHIPRRPSGIFAAELGNYLIAQFASSWDVNNPKNGEMERVVMIKCGTDDGTTSKCFASSASESGLKLDEVLHLLPRQTRIYASPGRVFFKAIDNGMEITIWSGDVNADEAYQPMPEHILRASVNRAKHSNLGAAGKLVLLKKKELPTNDPAVQEMVAGMYTPLALEKSDDLNLDVGHLREMYPFRMVFKPTSSQTYTGVEFSQTRFGSSKARPDLQTICNIRQQIQTSAQLCTSSTSSSSSKSTEKPPLFSTVPY